MIGASSKKDFIEKELTEETKKAIEKFEKEKDNSASFETVNELFEDLEK